MDDVLFRGDENSRVDDEGRTASRAADSESLRFCGRFWIAGADETFLGHGRIVLLERIRQHGSITKAAASMEMSYRHAWELVASMNRQSRSPLVLSSAGGRDGGGAVVTPAGECMIRLFRDLSGRAYEFVDEMQAELIALLEADDVPRGGTHRERP